MKIAFIGLGTMGGPMSARLLAAGHEVCGFDIDPVRAPTAGVTPTGNPASAAAAADVTFTSLPSADALREAVLGDSGVRSGARRDSVLIDVSTSAPTLSAELAAEMEPGGVSFLDAPVSGGPGGAKEGSLTIMVGGPKAAFARCEPLLSVLGKLVVWLGEAPGSGQVVKLCNNLIGAITMSAISEACAIAERHDIPADVLYEVLTHSTGDSRVLRTRYPLAGADAGHPVNTGFAPLFTVDLMVKDLRLAVEMSEQSGVPANSAAQALERYQAAQAAGLGELDYSAVHLTTGRKVSNG